MDYLLLTISFWNISPVHRRPELVDDMLGEMKRNRIMPDVPHYIAMIRIYCENLWWKEGMLIVKKVRSIPSINMSMWFHCICPSLFLLGNPINPIHILIIVFRYQPVWFSSIIILIR